jgi:hypothetical protein
VHLILTVKIKPLRVKLWLDARSQGPDTPIVSVLPRVHQGQALSRCAAPLSFPALYQFQRGSRADFSRPNAPLSPIISGSWRSKHQRMSSHDWMQALRVRSFLWCSVQLRWPNCPFSTIMTRRRDPESDHTESNIWSLFSSDNYLLYFPNFSTLSQMCQPPSVSPCTCVLAYFHKHFQGC